MPWSIFTQGGGKGAAVTWAKDLLSNLGVPQSNANITFVYDWEVSEGGGGKYNPLNQGPVPGHPELTSTGQQYGGGAADYVSWQAGITGASDYIHMPAYSGILAALKKSDYSAARSALIASPWAASHYGGGSGFSNATPPGAAPLANGGGSVSATTTAQTGFNPLNPASWLDALNPIKWIENAIGNTFKDILQRLGLILLGGILIIIGIYVLVKSQGNSTGDMQEAIAEIFAQERSARDTGVNTTVSESNTAVESTAA